MTYHLELFIANRVRPVKIAADQAHELPDGSIQFQTFEGKDVCRVSKKSLVSCEPPITQKAPAP
jgi:hypothetical protein